MNTTSLAAFVALSAVMTGCFLGASQDAESSQKYATPAGGIVAAHITSAKGNSNTNIRVEGLTSDRYALFLSSSSYVSSQAVVAFDVDQKCGGRGDGGADAGPFVSANGDADCVASGLTMDGSSTSIMVFEGAAGETFAPAGAGHDLYIVLRALDGKTLPPQVSITATDVTDTTGSDPKAPAIDPVTLP